MLLETEMETFRSELHNLLRHDGNFVLIIGAKVIDTFVAYEDALKEGYKQAGMQPFLVKQIHAIEKVQHLTGWNIEPCRI